MYIFSEIICNAGNIIKKRDLSNRMRRKPLNPHNIFLSPHRLILSIVHPNPGMVGSSNALISAYSSPKEHRSILQDNLFHTVVLNRLVERDILYVFIFSYLCPVCVWVRQVASQLRLRVNFVSMDSTFVYQSSCIQRMSH